MLRDDLSVGRSLAVKTVEDKKDNEPEQGGAVRSPGTINLSPEKQQLIGVKVMTVEKVSWNHTLRVLGRVVLDENRVYRINAATDGWVKQVLSPTTDSLVQKDELLATYLRAGVFFGHEGLPLRPAFV